jgi:hypothetical protein
MQRAVSGLVMAPGAVKEMAAIENRIPGITMLAQRKGVWAARRAIAARLKIVEGEFHLIRINKS